METFFQDGGQIIREKDIYHHGPKHIPIICQFPDPPSFSLPTTFKKLKKLVSNFYQCIIILTFSLYKFLPIFSSPVFILEIISRKGKIFHKTL
jgi:hypothetical protein